MCIYICMYVNLFVPIAIHFCERIKSFNMKYSYLLCHLYKIRFLSNIFVVRSKIQVAHSTKFFSTLYRSHIAIGTLLFTGKYRIRLYLLIYSKHISHYPNTFVHIKAYKSNNNTHTHTNITSRKWNDIKTIRKLFHLLLYW